MNVVGFRLLLVGSILAACSLAAQEAKEFRGRLPAHFSGIVTEGQRREIYRIQERYAEQIDELKAQLEALTKQRDEEIDAVLTTDQRRRLTKAREEAGAKRKKVASATKKAA